MQEIIVIQTGLKEKWKNIIQKYINKLGKKDIYLVYSGNRINEENIVEEIINLEDIKTNKMRILVNDIEKTIKKQKIISSKNIICPVCKESIKIRIKEYKIDLYDCKNGHKKENILLDEFENIQNLNESEIKCEKCHRSKSEVYNNLFYKCFECKINLCPLCKSIHDQSHNINDYDKSNYICIIHNEIYNSYCENCKKNICI